MPDRYWVGGTGNWSVGNTANWSATSGGAGGASVPLFSDNVFFDALSGGGTVTLTAPVCANLDFTGFTGTVTGGVTIAVWGTVFTIGAGVTWSVTGGLIQLNASSGTCTFNTNGKSLASPITFGANGGTPTWILAGAVTTTGALTVNSGTFTTNNFNVTASSLSSGGSLTRTINLGSSTVTLTGGGAAFSCTTTTGLTFNAGTSTLIFSANSPTIQAASTAGPALTFYNVSFTSSTVSTVNFTTTLASAPNNPSVTVNNLTVTAPSTAGVTVVAFSGACVVNGTLSTTGTAGNRRVWFRAVAYGIAQTLTINSAPSLTDADFRDLYVIGTAAPISGTRIGNLRGCRGITFSTPKTVYWNLAGTNNWNANAWATTPTGTPSTDNFPLAQDTATFTNAGAITQVNAFNFTGDYVGTVDMSGRTSAMTIQISNAGTVYGDWINGSGTTITNAVDITFSGRNTQTITSAGKTFPGGLIVDSYGGTVQLADALNIGTNTLTVTNGTFSPQNFNVTAGILSSSNSNVRTINLGSSTVTLSNTVVMTTATNLTLNAGTSTISISSSGPTFQGSTTLGLTFHNVSFTSTTATISATILSGIFTFNNLSFAAPATAGFIVVTCLADQTINGTLTVAGATAVRRIFVRSDTIGTTRTLTVNSLSAQDCDFRDITIAGAAAGSSPTRAGNCGGNTGITFPAPKTVYWNLAGAQNWSADGWATSSGGTPATNNFPLAQDTAVFDNTGSVTGLISIDQQWNIGTFDASARTTAMTFNAGGSSLGVVYGNWLSGTGLTITDNSGALTFSGRGVRTITSNGVTFGCPITINSVTGVVQLADALTIGSNRTMILSSGIFNAVIYNVTVGLFSSSGSVTRTLRMGSGTWTLSGVGNVWNVAATNLAFYKGSANIVVSDTSASARTFAGGGLSYNRLTIGGATGTSTLTISGNNQFTELASTKTVGHVISLGTTTLTLGAWTVTGTLANQVIVAGTATITIVGARVSGVDYLNMGTTNVSATSPGEFYAGANSTGTGSNVIFTAAPAPVTRYWRGGSNTWDASNTSSWSNASGGAGGFSVPTSADAVIFDSLSNATAYTVTIGGATARCASLTIGGPASGNLTINSNASIPLVAHGNVTFAATGVVSSNMSGGIVLSGSTTGRVFTTNGVALTANTDVLQINGVGSGWSLGSATNLGVNAGVNVVNGTFDTSSYNLTAAYLFSSNLNGRSVTLASSTVTMSGFNTPIDFGTNESQRASLSFSAGTSQINIGVVVTFNGNNQTFNNVAITASPTFFTFNGVNTFNNLSLAGITATDTVRQFILTADQTVTGTLTFSAGTDATFRTFVRSDTFGTTRTLTCAAFSGTDVDFRDITITGAAAPVSGTRLGDCKGNSGITFPAPKTVYWNLAGSNNWSATAWATSLGGSPAVNNFPLAQDTAVFGSVSPGTGATTTINATYNIGTLNMSARTSNTMTLAVGANNTSIYGNWINGTGTTLTGTGPLTFSGRTSQTITSAGVTYPLGVTIDSPGGTVTLQDAFNTSRSDGGALTVTRGTFNSNGFNVTLSGSGSSFVSNTAATTRTVAIGSSTWTIAGSATANICWNIQNGSTLTITGTGTISLTSASTKTFNGGGVSYSGITLNQGGAGTLTITGNNTFANISNTFKATGATNITLGTTTQTVGSFTAAGEAGRVLTIQGTSALGPATLIFTGAGIAANVDYLNITGIRAYSLDTTWYAGTNSTNNGSLGWYFESGGGGPIAAFIVENSVVTDAVSAFAAFPSAVSETTVVTDSGSAFVIFVSTANETTVATDAAAAQVIYVGSLSESVTAADITGVIEAIFAAVGEGVSAQDLTAVVASTFNAAVAELALQQDAPQATATFPVTLTEAAQLTDAVLGAYLWNPIDDTQNPNWQNVVNTQGSGWVQVNTDDTPNWQPTIEP